MEMAPEGLQTLIPAMEMAAPQLRTLRRPPRITLGQAATAASAAATPASSRLATGFGA
jgi:hypothetical protein